MRTIKEIVNSIDPKSENFSDLEVRCASIKRLYRMLKEQGRIKDMNRLRLLFHYYPQSMTEKVPIDTIVKCVSAPDIIFLNVSMDRDWFYGFEKYAIEKLNGNGSINRNFKLNDVYEYFGV